MFFQMEIGYLAHVGQNLANNAQETINKCYEASENSNAAMIHHEQEEIASEYRLIAYEVCQRFSRLSAGGFFFIDHSLILVMMTNICNYLIVIYQFIT